MVCGQHHGGEGHQTPYVARRKVWESLLSDWLTYATAWTKQAIPWREMSVPELVRLAYTDTLTYLKAEEPKKVRRFLTDMGDIDELRAWDVAQLKSTPSN